MPARNKPQRLCQRGLFRMAVRPREPGIIFNKGILFLYEVVDDKLGSVRAVRMRFFAYFQPILTFPRIHVYGLNNLFKRIEFVFEKREWVWPSVVHSARDFTPFSTDAPTGLSSRRGLHVLA
jgi:hypothetical protein